MRRGKEMAKPKPRLNADGGYGRGCVKTVGTTGKRGGEGGAGGGWRDAKADGDNERERDGERETGNRRALKICNPQNWHQIASDMPVIQLFSLARSLGVKVRLTS